MRPQKKVSIARKLLLPRNYLLIGKIGNSVLTDFSDKRLCKIMKSAKFGVRDLKFKRQDPGTSPVVKNPPFLIFFSIITCHRTLNIVPCRIHQDLVVCPSCTYSLHLLISSSYTLSSLPSLCPQLLANYNLFFMSDLFQIFLHPFVSILRRQESFHRGKG